MENKNTVEKVHYSAERLRQLLNALPAKNKGHINIILSSVAPNTANFYKEYLNKPEMAYTHLTACESIQFNLSYYRSIKLS